MGNGQDYYDIPTFIGVILSILVMGLGLWFMNRVFQKTIKEDLVKLVGCLLFMLFLVFVCDKVIVVRRPLLTDEESKKILDIIEKLVFMIFTAYFVTKRDKQ